MVSLSYYFGIGFLWRLYGGWRIFHPKKAFNCKNQEKRQFSA